MTEKVENGIKMSVDQVVLELLIKTMFCMFKNHLADWNFNAYFKLYFEVKFLHKQESLIRNWSMIFKI